MSQSGGYSGTGGGSSNYSYASSGQSANYNYLSFFAMGSFGRRLEAQRSRDPTSPVSLEEEKRRWKGIAGAAIACMFFVNIVAAIGLGVMKYQASVNDAAFQGDLPGFIQQEMKNMRADCLPKYRKTRECSQVAAQIVLVANEDNDSVLWRDENSKYKEFTMPTPGAFVCEGIEFDQEQGRLRVLSDGVYQIHSHVSVKLLASGETFQHEIRHSRFHWSHETTVAEETLYRDCSTASSGSACFSSSLLATEKLDKDDLIYAKFMINKTDIKHQEKILVCNGLSTYFGIIKLGEAVKT